VPTFTEDVTGLGLPVLSQVRPEAKLFVGHLS
jgi:hypothetical protein